MFAGSCIGVICLVLCLEFLRRVGREYDAFILRRARLRRTYLSESALASSIQPDSGNKNYQRINIVEDNNLKTTDCDRCCQVPTSAEDDHITPAPVPSEHSSTTQKQPTTFDTAKGPSGNSATKSNCADPAVLVPYRPSPVEQIIRALMHMLQFAVAYFIMLLAMYFNGYIIICIFIGAFLGSLIFSWEPISLNTE